jgi:hypothetical protein
MALQLFQAEQSIHQVLFLSKEQATPEGIFKLLGQQQGLLRTPLRILTWNSERLPL